MFKIIVSLLILVLHAEIQSILSSIVFEPPGTFSNYPRLTCTASFSFFLSLSLSDWSLFSFLFLNSIIFKLNIVCSVSDDYTADTYDNTKFYRCSNGYQYSFRCAPGTVYYGNAVCNYPKSVAAPVATSYCKHAPFISIKCIRFKFVCFILSFFRLKWLSIQFREFISADILLLE